MIVHEHCHNEMQEASHTDVMVKKWSWECIVTARFSLTHTQDVPEVSVRKGNEHFLGKCLPRFFILGYFISINIFNTLI